MPLKTSRNVYVNYLASFARAFLYVYCFCFWLTVFHFGVEIISNKSNLETMSKKKLGVSRQQLFLKEPMLPPWWLVTSSPSFMWPQIIYLVNSRDFPQMEVQVYKSVLCKIHTILLSKTKMTSLVSRLRKLLCVLSQIPQRLRTVVNTVFSNFLSS